MLKTPPIASKKSLKFTWLTIMPNIQKPEKKRTNMGTHLVYTYMDGVRVKSGG
jgi:hypothetical protein